MIISIMNTSTIGSLIVLTHLCIVKIHKSPTAHPDERSKAYCQPTHPHLPASSLSLLNPEFSLLIAYLTTSI